MRDERLGLSLAFCCALLPALIIPSLWPSLRLSFFAPFLVLVLYQHPLVNALWYSVASGLALDLLSSHPRLGLHALCYCLTIGLLVRFKTYLFIDKLTTIPAMTFLFSVISTLLQMFLLNLLGKGISPSWPWAATDLVLWPLVDSVYAFLWCLCRASQVTGLSRKFYNP